MDDIDIVKKRSHTWMWIVGLIILAVIIWAIVSMSGRGSTNPASEVLPAAPAFHAYAARLG